PFSELAVACEIERVLVCHGPDFVRNCILRLGPEIVDCLHFLEDDVACGEAHAPVRADRIDQLTARDPSVLVPLAQAGAAALEAYRAFLDDCLTFSMVRGQRLRA